MKTIVRLLFVVIILFIFIGQASAGTLTYSNWSNSTFLNTTTEPNYLIQGDSGDYFNRYNSSDLNANTSKIKWWKSYATVTIKNNAINITSNVAGAIDNDSNGEPIISVNLYGNDLSIYFDCQSNISVANCNGVIFTSTYIRIINSSVAGQSFSTTWNQGDSVSIYTSTKSTGLVIKKNGVSWRTFNPIVSLYNGGYVGLYSGTAPDSYDNYSVRTTLYGTATTPIFSTGDSTVWRNISFHGDIPAGATVSFSANSSECGFTNGSSGIISNISYELPSCAQRSNASIKPKLTSDGDYTPIIYDSSLTSDTVENIPPQVTLNFPTNGTTSQTSITFNLTATDNFQLQNVSLWGNFSGTWALNETKEISGISNTTIFTKVLGNGIYLWGIKVFDNNSNSIWSENRTLIVNSSANVATFLEPTPNNETYTHRSYVLINISSDIASSALLEWNGVNGSMTQSGTIWNAVKTFTPNGNYSFRIFVTDIFGQVSKSETRYVNISKNKLFFHNASGLKTNLYGYLHNTETPFSTYQNAIIANADAGLLHNFSNPADSPAIDERAAHALNLALSYMITDDVDYFNKGEEALNYLTLGTDYADGWRMGVAVGYSAMALYWIEGGINENNYTIIIDKYANYTNSTYHNLQLPSPTTVQYVDKLGRMYPYLGVAGALTNYSNTSLKTNSSDWLKVGTDYFFVEDLLHSYNRSLLSFTIDTNGFFFHGAYKSYVLDDTLIWFNIYSAYYNNSIVDDYPISGKFMLDNVWSTYPNKYSTNYITYGSTQWHDYIRAVVSMFGDDNKSILLNYMEQLEANPVLPYGQLTDGSIVSSFLKYLTFNNYTSLERNYPTNYTSILHSNSSGYAINIFRNNWNDNSSWLSFAVDNYPPSASNRDKLHHDQLNIEWYDRGDLLLADAGEVKYVVPLAVYGYTQGDVFHNIVGVEDPRSPFPLSIWANSSSRSFMKTTTSLANTNPPSDKGAIEVPEIEMMKKSVINNKVMGTSFSAPYTLSSNITYSRTVIFPKDYFVLVDTMDGIEPWTYRSIFRPTSFMTVPSNATTLEIGHINMTLYLDNVEYDWLSLDYANANNTGDNFTGINTENMMWKTVNPYNTNITASLYSVPSSDIVIQKNIGRIGGYNKQSEVYSPTVSFRMVNETNLNRITILQSNYSTETPRTTLNLSVDANHSGVLVTNSTIRDIITTSNSTNETYSNVTTNADVSFSRKVTNLSYISAINVSYFKYDSDVWVSSDTPLTSIFLNQTRANRTIVADGISGTNVSIYVSGTNYTVQRNGVTYTDWYMPDSTHLEINMTFDSPTTYELAGEEALTYSISGYVNDTLGASVDAVSVVNGTNSTTTNATGYYLIPSMTNGTYNFSYSKTGYVTNYKEIIIAGADRVNQNVTLTSSASVITIPANSWGIFNNWSENTNLSNIAANESNDVAYTFYNVTIGEWDSYYIGYSWNAGYTIDKNNSVLGFFNAETTITATTVTPWNTTITEGWNMLYLMGTSNQTLTAICIDMVNCTDIYYYNSTTNDYVSTGTDTIQPNQGFLAYVNQTGTWIRSTI